MSTRERWILYPLLFLTLGTVMRDKFFGQKHFRAINVTAPQVTADNINAYREITAPVIRCGQLEVGKLQCRRVFVTGPKGAEGVRIGVVPGRGGRLELCGTDEKPRVVAGVDRTGHFGTIETYDDQGAPQVKLLSTRAGGTVTTVRRDQKIWLVLGYAGPYYGVFAESPELGRGVALTLPWRFAPRPAGRSPPEDNGANRPASEDPSETSKQ